MKKTLKIISAILMTALIFSCFVSCGEPENVNGTATVVIASDPEVVYTVNLDEVEITEGVLSVVKYLAEKENLSYKADDSGYGAFLTEIGALKQDIATGTYIYIYTSVAKDFDVSEWATTKEWGGKTLTSSGFGISKMTVERDAIIYIDTEVYGS